MTVPEALANLCRMCMSSKGKEDIFPSFSMKISILTSIEVQSSDQLPKKLCESCVYQLEKFYIFRKVCKKSDSKYRSFLRKARSNKIKSLDELSDDEDEHVSDDTNQVYVEDYEQKIVDHEVAKKLAKSQDSLAAAHEETLQQELASQRKKLLAELKLSLLETINSFADEKTIEDHIIDYNVEEENEANQQMHIQFQYEEEADSVAVVVDNAEVERTSRRKGRPKELELFKIENYMEEDGSADIDTTIIVKDGLIYDCSHCDRKFHTLEEKKNHERNHRTSKNVCKICNKVFSSSGVYTRHMKIHSEAKEWSCEDCGKCFIQKGTLMRHALMHKNLKPFPCQECSKGFTQRHLLTKHEEMHHSEIPIAYRFRCKDCPKAFNHSSGLSRHALTHTGKKYPCPVCEIELSDASAVKRHVRAKHPDQSE